ncbi:hypothetical protein, partial [uncultured Bradyrhizobium sp.]|uniref:hypothetical protein n=1 Tax=uncultured Bradyrhizobium sp. TaxID=199684 RepID=UPI00261E51E4
AFGFKKAHHDYAFLHDQDPERTSSPANEAALRASTEPYAVSNKAKGGEQDSEKANFPTTGCKQSDANQIDREKQDGPS